jgi:hypothetical protein
MKYEIVVCPECGVDVVGQIEPTTPWPSMHGYCNCGYIITESDWGPSKKAIFTLNIKRQWFDMIKSGEKPWEYREIKPAYDRRIIVSRCLPEDTGMFKVDGRACSPENVIIQYINGMQPDAPRWFVHCSGLRVGDGDPELGAVPCVWYYCIGNGRPVSGQGD